MIRQIHQRSIFNDVDEPKSSARIRCLSSNQSSMNEFKSIKKQCSKKFIRPFSPKKTSNHQTKQDKKPIPKAEQNYRNTFSQNNQFYMDQKDCLSSHRALKTLDTNRITGRHNLQPNPNILLSSQKSKKNHKSLIERFQSNETKIILMRQQLQKVFQTFKQREKEMQQKKSELKNRDQIKAQNQFLSKQISRVQQMIKQALLQRQKLKHGQLSKRIK